MSDDDARFAAAVHDCVKRCLSSDDAPLEVLGRFVAELSTSRDEQWQQEDLTRLRAAVVRALNALIAGR